MAPFVKVRIAGREFDDVHAEAAPEMADRVADAMAAKYWSDLVRVTSKGPAERSPSTAGGSSPVMLHYRT